MALLEVRRLSKVFGGISAVDGLDFTVDGGGILSIIGPNGAGKTTLFNVLTGVYTPTEGHVFLEGEEVTHLTPYQRAAKGMSRTFQNVQAFLNMSAVENVMVGYHLHSHRRFVSSLLRLPKAVAANQEARDKAAELMEYVGLGDYVGMAADSLPYGALKRLEIARALATEPKILMLDEPAAGLNPTETQALDDLIQEIAANGVTILLVEHDMRLVMGISDHIIVLDHRRLFGRGGKGPLSMLEITGLAAHYGPIQALKGVDVSVGELVALVGANGAGKTTLMRTLSGVLPASAGEVLFDGTLITGLSADARVRLGISQVPEGRQVFGPMSVVDNLKLGAYTRPRREIAESLARVYDMFPRLEQRQSQAAGTLSGGEQQMLALSRALMAKPKLLLLDEPSMGLSPILVDETFDAIVKLRDAGTTVFVVEQNAFKALAIADRGYVMETGRTVLTDTASALLEDERVKEAYLGI